MSEVVKEKELEMKKRRNNEWRLRQEIYYHQAILNSTKTNASIDNSDDEKEKYGEEDDDKNESEYFIHIIQAHNNVMTLTQEIIKISEEN